MSGLLGYSCVSWITITAVEIDDADCILTLLSVIQSCPTNVK